MTPRAAPLWFLPSPSYGTWTKATGRSQSRTECLEVAQSQQAEGPGVSSSPGRDVEEKK